MQTAQRILNLLNRKPLRVSELAEALGISRNSAYVQVTKLEAAGVIEKLRPASHSSETPSTVGKPAFRYRTAARHEDTYSAAYKTVLTSLIDTLGTRLDEEARRELLEQAGRHLAGAAGLAPTADFASDFQRALEAVNGLGAMAEDASVDDTPSIRCHTCPIATLVHKEPAMCSLVASFFSAATDRPVTVRCQHERTVVCGFSFGSTDSITLETNLT